MDAAIMVDSDAAAAAVASHAVQVQPDHQLDIKCCSYPIPILNSSV
jgi:hypothetical protein